MRDAIFALRSHGWFTEGFDTLDLKEAKALLDELALELGQAKPVKARCITSVVLNSSSARLTRERS